MRTLITTWRDTAISLSKVSKRKVPSKGLPFSTYAPRGGWGGGGVKPPIHSLCVVHAKRGWVGPDSM